MRRFLLLLALSIIVATLSVLGGGVASAAPPQGAGCKGLFNAALASQNLEVFENVLDIERDCFDIQPLP